MTCLRQSPEPSALESFSPELSDLLRWIVSNARGIEQRLDEDVLPADRQEVEQERLLEQWKRVVADGEQEVLDKRLSWTGLGADEIRSLLGRLEVSPEALLPDWAIFLGEAIQECEDAPTPALPQELEQQLNQGYAFWEVLHPFLRLARRRFEALAGEHAGRISAEALSAAELSFLHQLSRYACRSLYVDFDVFRNMDRHKNPGPWMCGLYSGDTRVVYDRYLGAMREGRLRDFVRSYCVLGRVLANSSMQWAEAMAEFAQRVNADAADLQSRFGKDATRVTGLSIYLSDLHNRGRAAMRVEFGSGLSLIYKPKTLDAEANYQHLLDWINRQGHKFGMQTLRILSRSTHGWVERIAATPLLDDREAALYFYRAGVHLCLLYLLEGTDCHCENIIAVGDQPVLVDLETLLHNHSHADDYEQPKSIHDLAWQELQHSVLKTHLLPSWQFTAGQVVDISGLGGGDLERETHDEVRVVLHPNSDGMKLDKQKIRLSQAPNRAAVGETQLQPSLYKSQIIQGFRDAFDTVLRNRSFLLDDAASPIRAMEGQRTRIILRDTRIYIGILRQAIYPRNMRSGAEFSIFLDIVSRRYIHAQSKQVRQFALLEKQALERLDVPYFYTYSNETALYADNGTCIDNVFKLSAWDSLIDRLRNLQPGECEKQVGFIKGSLYTRMARAVEGQEAAVGAVLDSASADPLPQEKILQLALRIGDEICEHAIRSQDGSLSWIGLAYAFETSEYQLRPMGLNHFEGLTGVSIFLAAASSITGATHLRDAANRVVDSIEEALRNDEGFQYLRRLGVGGAMGSGSVAYGLLKTGQLLGQPKLVERALSLLPTFDDEAISADKRYDVMFGSAGAILSLRSLYEATGEKEILGRIRSLAEHLVDESIETGPGARGWMTLSKEHPLCGFSHGGSGIGYALAEAGRLLEDGRLLKAASEAYAYERSRFDTSRKLWPDYRFPRGAHGFVFQRNWCNGSAGVGMARLASAQVLDDPHTRSDADLAIEAALQDAALPSDTLCCGYLGRYELLAAASRQNRIDNGANSDRLLSAIVQRSEQKGAFTINWDDGPFNPGIFQGVSGIGYHLLRHLHPEKLPCLLLWE